MDAGAAATVATGCGGLDDEAEPVECTGGADEKMEVRMVMSSHRFEPCGVQELR